MKKHLSLKAARETKGWTQERLVAETRRVDETGEGLTQSHISKIERGDVTDPNNSTVVLLEKALAVKRGTLVFADAAVTS